MNAPHFFVVTGGPGAGKTTLIDVLASRGFAHVAEAGRQIIREQKKIGGDAPHDGDRRAYRDLMLARSIADHRRMSEAEGPVFFDRGIPDLAGYCRSIGTDVPAAVSDAVGRYRHNRRAFMAPPWREIYRQDMERQQDFGETVATHEAIMPQRATRSSCCRKRASKIAPISSCPAFALYRPAGTASAQPGMTPGSMSKTSGPIT